MTLHLREPGSAITHGIAAIMTALASIPLLYKAASIPDHLHLITMGIFILTMFLLYMASTLYHSIEGSETLNRRLRKVDHMMISVMIAGSYTPICLIVLHNRLGYTFCAIIWAAALCCILIKAFWITCPKWFSSVLYIGMGWLCIFAFFPLVQVLPRAAFWLLLAGGILYTIGGVIYALKLPLFNKAHKNFGSHEIFHVFIMMGSVCHFIVMYVYVASMPL